MTGLHLLVADMRHTQLCVLGCKFCRATVPGSCLPEASSGLSRHPPTFFDHEFLPLLLSQR